MIGINGFVVENKSDVENELFHDLSIICSYIGVICAFYTFISKSKSIVALVNDMATFEASGIPPNIEEVNKSYNFYAKMYTVYCMMGPTISAVFGKYFEEPICENKNREYGRDEICFLMTPIWLPFKFDYTPLKEVVSFLQVFSAGFALSCGGTVNFLTFICMQNIIERIRYLQQNYGAVFVNKTGQRNRLYRCIQHHNTVIQ